MAVQAFCQGLWFIPDDNLLITARLPPAVAVAVSWQGPGLPRQVRQGWAGTGTQWHSCAMGRLAAGRATGLHWQWPSPSLLFYFLWGL